VGEPVPLLPVGTQTWRVHDAGSWTDSTLTVTLLVRNEISACLFS
jgi:hypothetical protein